MGGWLDRGGGEGGVQVEWGTGQWLELRGVGCIWDGLLCVELAEPGIEDGVSWDLRFEAPKDGGPIPADCGMLGELGATGG